MKKLVRIFLVLVLCYTNLQVVMANSTGEGIGKLNPRLNRVSNLFAAPDAPTNLVASGINTGGMIQFTAPVVGSPITNYEYSTDNGVTWITPSPAITQSPIIISSGLTNCTTYQVKIRAVNTVGSGTASAAVQLIPATSVNMGLNWSTRISAADNSWRSITYGNGLFVAVAFTGAGNRVMTSPDGITWTAQTSVPNNDWRSVTYGNGLFVAVSNSTGTSNQVMTSSDGITWTAQTSAANNQWFGVTYGNGLFVAVASSGSNNRVMTSADGINWTIQTSAPNNDWRAVTYGNGLFVAVAQTGTGNRVMTSADGITWIARTSAADNSWNSVTYGNGVFVAVASSGIAYRVMTSPDGIKWTTRNASANNNWFSVTYGNGLFVAVANSGTGNRVMTSPDGETWTSRTSATDNAWNGVTYGNGVFVAVATSGTGNRVMTSSYNTAANPPVITSITPSTNSVSVAFTQPASVYAPAVSNYEYSTDNGSTWTTRDPVSTAGPITITGLNEATVYAVKIRAINTVGTSCESSAESATTLSYPSAPTNLVATGINTGGIIQFTAPARDGGQSITNYEYSTDGGTTWITPSPAITSSPLIISSGLTNCTPYQVKIRAVNASGSGDASDAVTLVPSTSTIGVNWTSRTSAADNSWQSVTYGNGVFVAVGGGEITNRVMTSPDGLTWTSRTSSGSDNQWNSVTYGNGLFVAVSSFGNINDKVMTSPDGITWTSRTSAANNQWGSVTFGNGLFVAVASFGSGNRVMTSPDGITWTARNAAAENTWRSVTYGNGLFVAVSDDGTNRVMTSSDGITWNSSNAAANLQWQSVTYGNGLFVAVARNGSADRVMTSPDGITWTSRTSAADSNWTSVTNGNGLFVAIAQRLDPFASTAQSSTVNQVMTSPDGINWTARNLAVNNDWRSVTYGNGLFVAVASFGSGNLVMTSGYDVVADAPVITSITPSTNSVSVAFTQSASTFALAVSNYEYSTDNGSTWTILNPVATASPITITGLIDATAYTIKIKAINTVGTSCESSAVSVTTLTLPGAPTNLVATGINTGGMIQFTAPAPVVGSPITNYEYSTDNGVTWITPSPAITQSPIIISSGLTNCTTYQVKIRAVNAAGRGTESSAVELIPATSVDMGENWTQRTSAADNSWRSITYGNGLFVAVAFTGTTNRVMTSPDGITWTAQTSVPDNNWRSVTYGNGLFVAVSNSTGTSNQVMTSSDGITWTAQTSAADNQWFGVTYGNGLFVAVASTGTNRVMSSADGITWTSRTSAPANEWRAVTYGNGLFVAVAQTGAGNRVMTSADGITWTSRTSAANNSWNSVTYGNGLFVAVASTGSGNRVMTSPDGITWTPRNAAAENSWLSVTYGNGLFVAVATTGTGNRVMTSADGETWTSRTSAVDNQWNGVTYGNGVFVAVATTGTDNRVMTSSYNTVANPPVITSITEGSNSVSVAFTQPASVYAPAVSNYEYSTDNGSTWTTRDPISTSSPITISGLNEATVYAIRIRAINTVGTSCESSAESATTLSLPSAPTNLVASGINTGGIIQFTAPARDGGQSITNYEYSTDGGATWITPSPAITSSPLIISSGLINCTPYQVKIRAVNSVGSGAASAAVTLTPSTSTIGENWTTRTSAADNSWQSVTYGNGVFVAVGGGKITNRVMTSPDGLTWTSRTSSGSDNQWNSVTYGNGLFVAVSSFGNINDKVMTSPDGITWTSRTSAANNQWGSVTFGNGLFVAVASFGSGNRVMTSPDGITWTARNAAAENTWRSVTYGNGLFVAVSDDGTNRVMTSSDGITWNSSNAAANLQWQSVTYGNGLFVAVARNGSADRVMTSPDGITWTSRTSAADSNWTSVTNGNGLFVAIAQRLDPFASTAQSSTVNQVMTSPDGINWTARNLAVNNDWRSVTYGNGLFVAVASFGSGNLVMTSGYDVVADAPVITSITPSTNSVSVAFTQSASTFALAVSNYEYSTDNGSTWTILNPVATASPITITGLIDATAYTIKIKAINTVGTSCESSAVSVTTLTLPGAPTNLVATGINTGGMIQFTAPAPVVGSPITNYEYSTDNGVTWITPSPAITQSPIIISSGLTNCTTYQVKIRAVNAAGRGTESSAVELIPATSVDMGENWTQRTSAADNSWRSITYGNGLFVAVAFTGTTNRVMTSPDGITWTAQTSVPDNNWRSVTYGNGLFVAVSNSTGTSNQVMTSSDGITWTAQTSAADNQWFGVTYGNGLFVAVASTGTNRVMSSADGITWTSRTSAPANEWRAVTYGNGLFVAVAQTGAGNRVMTSADGITWTSRTSAANNSWNSVTYGNGLFVAVASTGSGNRVMTSPDGITWTPRNAAAENSWLSVTYGNGLFVAVATTGTGNRVMTSADGETWTSRTSAVDNQWNGVTYGNGVFVAVATTGTDNRVMTSSYNTVANPPVITSITEGSNSVSVAFTQPASVYAPAVSNYEYSTDNGSTWTTRDPISTSSPITISGLNEATVYAIRIRAINTVGTSCESSAESATTLSLPSAPTNLVASGINTGGIIQFTAPARDGGQSITNYEYSTDGGATWITPSPAITSSPLIISSGLINCTPYQVKIRAVNSVGSGAASAAVTLTPSTSTIGENWTTRTSAADNSWQSVTYGNGVFVAVGGGKITNRVMTSPDGLTWTSRTSSGSDNQWNSVTYGNGLFVAVSSFGNINDKVMTSPDGITWTSRTSAANNQWGSVTFGNGLFVAVASFGSGNRVMTSPDGITWTARNAAAENTWRSVTYGNGLFVAVSDDGTNRVMTSSDGITWNSSNAAANLQWQSVTYGNGLFVAVARNGSADRVMTSPDGITWTSRTSAADSNWTSVTNGNGLFVAIAQRLDPFASTAQSSTVNQVMTSPDGINWTARNLAVNNDWRSVTYGNGLFVAVASFGSGNLVMTSGYDVVADAPVITSITPSTNSVSVAFTQSASTFALAVSNYEYSTDNGSTWTILNPVATASPITITGLIDATAYTIKIKAINTVGTSCESSAVSVTTLTLPGAPTNLVATGINTGGMIQFTAPAPVVGSPITNYEYSTDNGVTWITPSPAITQSPIIISSGLTNCTTYQVKIRAVNAAGRGTESSAVELIPATSVDMGENWTQRTSAADNSWRSITYGNGLFVAVAFTGTTNRVMTSPDGITWTAQTSVPDNNWRSVTYGNGLFVAVSNSTGTSNQVMTSSDGITWTAQTSAADNQWFGVTYGNGLFVAVASTGTNRVMSSADGITWTSRTSAPANEWRAVTYGNGLFVAVAQTGAGNRVMTSADGITWTSRTSAANNSWNSVTYGNGLFVAVASTGSGNRVMTSPDGITWTPRNAAAENSWLSVTYGNGLFVAVATTGTGNRVMTSADGETWTSRTSAVDNQWNGVTYGNGVFVAVATTGTDNRVMTSSYNTVANPPVITSVESRDGGARVFFTATSSAYAPPTTNYEYSIDNGVTFSALNPSSNQSPITINGLTNGSTYAVRIRGVNSVGASCTSSAESVSLSVVTVPGAPSNLATTGINTGGMIQFTSPASDGGSTITNYEYSTDNGSTWTTPTPAITTSPLIISSGLINCTPYQVKIRAVNSAGRGTASSAVELIPAVSVNMGENWTQRTSAADNNWRSVTYGNGIFVAVAASGTGNRVMTSPDGITWTARTSAADNSWNSVTYGNGVFVAVATSGIGNRVMTSADGIIWTARTSAESNEWRDVTYGNGLFVAVASTGTNRVMTSPDGITWTSQTSAAANEWRGVTYGNGLFVAVAQTGTNNRVMTSADGITWTIRTSAANNSWNSVTYGNGLFVAVSSSGIGNRVMTSPDGITWNSKYSATDNQWFGVTYGNGLFVAVANTGTDNRVMTSPNGETWTTRTSASDNSWQSITYGNGLFVAVATTGIGNRLMTSSYSVVANAPEIDSITSRDGGANVFFTATSSIYAPPTSNYEYSTDNGVTFSALNPSSNQSPITINGLTNGSTYAVRIRAVNLGGASCTSSAQSVSLSVVTVPGAPINLVATGINTGGMIQFTIPASDGGSAITNYEYSTDNGANWVTPSPAITQSPIIISSGLTNCTTYQVKIRAVNSAGFGTASSAVELIPAVSVDMGENWTQRTSIEDIDWRSITYGKGLFVAVAFTGTGNRVMTSPDGITWTARTSAVDNYWTSVTYGNGLFVAVSNSDGSGNRVMISLDGITWTSRASAADNFWNSVTYGNGLFVAVASTGNGNRVMTSSDGINWTLSTSAPNNEWSGVTYGNGKFVAVAKTGIANRVMTSVDGINWTARTSAANNSWNSITYGNGLFVTVASSGSGNRVMTSPDGITWTARNAAVENSWLSVTYGNGLFVAVASSGIGNRVMTSPDGETWTSKTSATDNQWNSVTYGNGVFVAVSGDGTSNRVMTSGYSIVADAPMITAALVSQSEATVSFTQSTPALAPAITNYRYSIDYGTTWTTLSPASTTSPITVSGVTEFKNQIQLQAINSVGNSCPAIYLVVGINLNKSGQKSSIPAQFVNKNGALGISGIRSTGESRINTPFLSATAAVTSITATTATSGGTVGADGGASVSARGVCWSTTTNPTIANSKTTDGTGTGTFTSAITGLTSGTTHYVRSYATNSVGTTYGPEVIFTTP
jgi:hypothetical protein